MHGEPREPFARPEDRDRPGEALDERAVTGPGLDGADDASDDTEDDEAEGQWLDDTTVSTGKDDVGGIFGDRFRVDGELGEGAMGRVVGALDMQTGAQVALKILHRPKKKSGRKRSTRSTSSITPGSPGSEQRFIREVVALSAIDHPAVVKIVAHDRAPDGRWWIAMELLRGETLGARLKRVGKLSLAEAWPILSTLCGGLAAAHRAGFVHRDLKPENVFLPEGGRPACKILDFGFARHKTQQERITATGALIGTPRFMAPEILADAKVLDARADVYAVGVIAFEMLAGRSLYPADDFAQLFGCILQGRTIPLRSVLPDAPEALEQLLADATARYPEQRLASVEDFALRLADVVGMRSDGPQTPRMPSERPPLAAPTIASERPPTPSSGSQRPASLRPDPAPALGPPSRSPGPIAPREPSTASRARRSVRPAASPSPRRIVLAVLVVAAVLVIGAALRMAH
ncbi:MAG: protein kinase [Sandaracinaceae bacterium]|nr:protein kinase [Sandaracinaceae bacterium]